MLFICTLVLFFARGALAVSPKVSASVPSMLTYSESTRTAVRNRTSIKATQR